MQRAAYRCRYCPGSPPLKGHKCPNRLPKVKQQPMSEEEEDDEDEELPSMKAKLVLPKRVKRESEGESSAQAKKQKFCKQEALEILKNASQQLQDLSGILNSERTTTRERRNNYSR